MCANPRAPPPLRTNPTFGREAGVASWAGADRGTAESVNAIAKVNVRSVFITYFRSRVSSLSRRSSWGTRLAVLITEPDANLVANPRNVSAAVSEYGNHHGSGKIAKRFTWMC